MNEHQTSRTLLKSPPELWAECSDAQSLVRHLGEAVGEIRITKLEPEHTVAWEGDRASGTVKLEPSGWGTRVTLTCSMAAGDGLTPEAEEAAPEAKHALREPEQKPDADRAPEATSTPISEPAAAPPRGRLLQRVRRFLGPARGTAEPGAAPPDRSAAEPAAAQPSEAQPAAPTPEPRPSTQAPESQPVPEPPAPESVGPPDEIVGADALAAALDSLGQAHHRPFSRA